MYWCSGSLLQRPLPTYLGIPGSALPQPRPSPPISCWCSVHLAAHSGPVFPQQQPMFTLLPTELTMQACCRSPSLSGLASRCRRRRRRAIAGTGRGRQWRDADEPERQVPGGSPASVSRGVGGNSRTSKGLRGPGQAPGGAGGLCRGPSEETHRVGGLGGWSGAAGGGQSSGTTPRCRPME